MNTEITNNDLTFPPQPITLVSRCCGYPDTYNGMGHLSDYGRCGDPMCGEVCSYVTEAEYLEGSDATDS